MNNVIIVFNSFGCAFGLIAILLSAYAVKKEYLYWQSGIFLLITLTITLFVLFSNILEYTGISDTLDSFEEYFELLIIPSMIIFFYSQASEDEIKTRHENEKELQRLLEDRKIIIHELHHRIRNNIQVIYSLLSLQNENSDSPEIRMELNTAINRIEAVGAVNFYLYNTEDSACIDMETCFSDLADNLISHYKLNRDEVVVNISENGVSKSIDTVIPCCVIINELVCNVFSYIVRCRKSSELWLDIHDTEDEQFEIILKCTGCDVSGDDVLNGTNISKQIIENLVLQMNGTKEIHENNSLEIIFKLQSL